MRRFAGSAELSTRNVRNAPTAGSWNGGDDTGPSWAASASLTAPASRKNNANHTSERMANLTPENGSANWSSQAREIDHTRSDSRCSNDTKGAESRPSLR